MWPKAGLLEWGVGTRSWKDLGSLRGWWRDSISGAPGRGHSLDKGLVFCELWDGRDPVNL